jgi:hypothetical protein
LLGVAAVGNDGSELWAITVEWFWCKDACRKNLPLGQAHLAKNGIGNKAHSASVTVEAVEKAAGMLLAALTVWASDGEMTAGWIAGRNYMAPVADEGDELPSDTVGCFASWTGL